MIIKPRSTDAFFKPPPAPKTPGVGPRMKKRQAENQKLNKRLKIRECEIRLPGCWKRSHLGWAHSKKSRFLTSDADWQEAAKACVYCHKIIEAYSHAEMKAVILDRIAKRRPHAHSYDS